jgi:hypothetical protein
MLFPLSRDYCLVGAYSAGPDRIELESDQVHNLNRTLVRQADRFVYSPFDADYIQDEMRQASVCKSAEHSVDIIQF